MLEDQINALLEDEERYEKEIKEAQEKIKNTKKTLTAIKKARKQLEKLQDEVGETEPHGRPLIP